MSGWRVEVRGKNMFMSILMIIAGLMIVGPTVYGLIRLPNHHGIMAYFLVIGMLIVFAGILDFFYEKGKHRRKETMFPALGPTTRKSAIFACLYAFDHGLKFSIFEPLSTDVKLGKGYDICKKEGWAFQVICHEHSGKSLNDEVMERIRKKNH